MKKQLMILMTAALLLAGCNSNEEEDALKQYGVEDTKSCDNLAAVKQAGDKLVKDKESVYCAITTDKNLDQATAFVKKDYDAKRISEFLNLPYYHKELTERYIAYDDGKRAVQDIVTKVNIGLDQPYFTNVDIIRDTDDVAPVSYTHLTLPTTSRRQRQMCIRDRIRDTDDVALLVNKYHRLPDDYEPQNLVKTPNACVIGEDFSCQSEPQYLRKEVADAFSELVKAGKAKHINIKAIASYRSFAYQKNLYDYYEQSQGKEYADKYYARPGQSEHNSALAVDVTINDENFNEIENSEHYDWLLKHIADYGFILRYPEDKVDVTGYQYESWHLRYVGKDIAKEIVKQGLTLDEYIARKDVQK